MLKEPKLTGAEARRERGRQEMRAAILEAAGRLVAAEGVEGFTIRAVAQAVGYSAGALYEYFDSKESILASLYFDGADGLAVHCERAVANLPSTAGAVEAILALGRAYRSYALDHPELYRLVFGDFKSPPVDIDCDDVTQGGFNTILRVVAHGIDEGTLIDVPPPAVSFAAWAAVHGFVSLEVTGHITGGEEPGAAPADAELARETRDQYFEGLLRMTLGGILSDEGRTRLTWPEGATSGIAHL